MSEALGRWPQKLDLKRLAGGDRSWKRSLKRTGRHLEPSWCLRQKLKKKGSGRRLEHFGAKLVPKGAHANGYKNTKTLPVKDGRFQTIEDHATALLLGRASPAKVGGFQSDMKRF